MYLRKKDANALLKQFDKKLRDDLKVSIETIGKLAEESDWNFIIKSHSLIESLINDLLISKIGENELKETIEFLPLHDSKNSKLKIIKSYNLLDQKALSFIRNFSELRNRIVHSFDQSNFDFKNHVENLDKNQRKAWIKTLTWYADDKNTIEVWSNALPDKSRYAFWMAVQVLVFSLYIQMNLAKGKVEIDKISEETTQEIIKKLA